MRSQEEQWLLGEKYNGVKSDAFYADCKALALGTPLGYLIGHVPFLDCTIHLDNHPLIPRVETEYWTERAINTIKESIAIQPNLALTAHSTPQLLACPSQTHPDIVTAPLSEQQDQASVKILDLCAGSGCIGVAVAKHIPDAQVDFAELNQRLIPTIEKNCQDNEIAENRYTVYHSNLLASIPAENKYDFILSNPPYIDPAIDRATESVKTYEPHLALYGGAAGLEIIEQLIQTAAAYLAPGGQLWIEHEPEQSAAINAIAAERGFASTNYQDQYNLERYSILVYDPDALESGARLES